MYCPTPTGAAARRVAAVPLVPAPAARRDTMPGGHHRKRQCPRAELDAEGLHPIASQLYLWSMVSYTSHRLLSHFLLHYSRLGVRMAQAYFLLQAPHGREGSLKASMDVFVEHGVPRHHVELTDAYHSQLKAQGVSRFVRALPQDAWLLYVDVDEFVVLPRGFMSTGADAFCARMVDRMASTGSSADALRASIPSVSPPSSAPIGSQYPICVQSRADAQKTRSRVLIDAWNIKLVLFRARIRGVAPVFRNSHEFTITEAGSGSASTAFGGPDISNCHMLGGLNHYSFTQGQAQMAYRKADVYRAANTSSGYLNVNNRLTYEAMISLMARDADSGTVRLTQQGRKRLLSRRTCCPDEGWSRGGTRSNESRDS